MLAEARARASPWWFIFGWELRVGDFHRAQLGWRALRALAPQALKRLVAWLAGCPLAGWSAKCYYTGVTAALCSETVPQHSPEIRVVNTEAVCNDFHSEALINAHGSNCFGYFFKHFFLLLFYSRAPVQIRCNVDRMEQSWSDGLMKLRQ